MLDNGMKREDSVKDIGALLDWIATRKELDTRRVLVTGGSYGGYMTLAAMAHYNDRLRGGVDVVGIANWITFFERTEAYRRDLRRVEYGDEREPAMRAFLEKISPVRHASKITKPMLVVQGKNDPRVPVYESRQIVEAIRKNGTPVWYIEAADEGHGFAKKANQHVQFAATVMFVEKFLLQ
jgi:dipeptidyl aminopeptidase/acylaminoacyl peptidase